jgi:LDH2 family malate/lactate/ureidoglycolate dehydrogenase
MVEILSAMLAGAAYAPMRDRRDPDAERYNVGHFFLALDPKSFRDEGEFEAELDDMIDALRAMPSTEPGRPVLVAGDPEAAAFERRRREGIPVPDHLVASVRTIATAAGAPFLLEEGA